MSYSSDFIEQLNFEGDVAFKLPFDKMCKRFGKDLMEFLKDSWKINSECLTEKEFCDYYKISTEFFYKRIK